MADYFISVVGLDPCQCVGACPFTPIRALYSGTAANVPTVGDIVLFSDSGSGEVRCGEVCDSSNPSTECQDICDDSIAPGCMDDWQTYSAIIISTHSTCAACEAACNSDPNCIICTCNTTTTTTTPDPCIPPIPNWFLKNGVIGDKVCRECSGVTNAYECIQNHLGDGSDPNADPCVGRSSTPQLWQALGSLYDSCCGATTTTTTCGPPTSKATFKFGVTVGYQSSCCSCGKIGTYTNNVCDPCCEAKGYQGVLTTCTWQGSGTPGQPSGAGGTFVNQDHYEFYKGTVCWFDTQPLDHYNVEGKDLAIGDIIKFQSAGFHHGHITVNAPANGSAVPISFGTSNILLENCSCEPTPLILGQPTLPNRWLGNPLICDLVSAPWCPCPGTTTPAPGCECMCMWEAHWQCDGGVMVGDPNSPNCETGHWTMGPGVGSATGNMGDNGYVGCACQDPEGSIDLSSLGHGTDPTGGLFDQWVVVDCACGMQTGGTGWCNEGGYTTGCDLLWVGSPGCEDCNDPEAPDYCDETGMGPGPDGSCAADGNLQWGQAGLWLPPAPWAPTAFGYGAVNGPIVFGSAPTNSGCIPCDCQPTVQGGDGCDHCDYHPECLNGNGIPYTSVGATKKECLCLTTCPPTTTTTPDPCDFSQVGATANGSDAEKWFIIDAALCPGSLCVDFEAYSVPDWIGIFTSANSNHSIDPSDVALLNHTNFGAAYINCSHTATNIPTSNRLHQLFNIPAGIQFVKIVVNYGGNCTGGGTAWRLKYQAGPNATNTCPATTTTCEPCETEDHHAGGGDSPGRPYTCGNFTGWFGTGECWDKDCDLKGTLPKATFDWQSTAVQTIDNSNTSHPNRDTHVWKIIIEHEGDYTFSLGTGCGEPPLTSGSFDSFLCLFCEDPQGNMTLIANNDDSAGNQQPYINCEVISTSGCGYSGMGNRTGIYYLVVKAYSGQSGDYILSWKNCPCGTQSTFQGPTWQMGDVIEGNQLPTCCESLNAESFIPVLNINNVPTVFDLNTTSVWDFSGFINCKPSWRGYHTGWSSSLFWCPCADNGDGTNGRWEVSWGCDARCHNPPNPPHPNNTYPTGCGIDNARAYSIGGAGHTGDCPINCVWEERACVPTDLDSNGAYDTYLCAPQSTSGVFRCVTTTTTTTANPCCGNRPVIQAKECTVTEMSLGGGASGNTIYICDKSGAQALNPQNGDYAIVTICATNAQICVEIEDVDFDTEQTPAATAEIYAICSGTQGNPPEDCDCNTCGT